MKLEEALIQQSPSLALQRAASDEISRLKHLVKEREKVLAAASEMLYTVLTAQDLGEELTEQDIERCNKLVEQLKSVWSLK